MHQHHATGDAQAFANVPLGEQARTVPRPAAMATIRSRDLAGRFENAFLIYSTAVPFAMEPVPWRGYSVRS